MTYWKQFAFLLLFAVCSIAAAQQRTVGTIDIKQGVSPGYVLFTQLGNETTYLIDMEGRVVNTWTSEEYPGQMAYFHENGYLYRLTLTDTKTRFNGGNGGAARIECLTWENDVVWSYEYASDTACIHHDICPMPNGNVLFIAWEHIAHDEAVGLGKDTAGFSTDIWPDKVVEIAPDGNGSATIVWEWRVWDHLVQDRDPALPNYGVISEHPGRIDINAPIRVGGWIHEEDWLHCNGVKYNEELDQIVISSRHSDEIWIVDHSTTMEEAAGSTGGRYGRGGDLLYRWGNPMMYGRGTAEDRKLFGQHDPQWIPEGYPGAGHLLLFNNGEILPEFNRAYSTPDEIVPPIQPDGSYRLEEGQPYGPVAPVWSFKADPPESLFGRFVSGTNRMPGGNTVICNGMSGEFYEVTPQGEIVWHYVNPVSGNGILQQGDTARNNLVFKMRKYPPEHPAFTGRDMTPGARIEETPVSVADVPAAAAGHIMADIYPNPFSATVQLRLNESAMPVRLAVYDVTGKQVARLHSGSVRSNGMTLRWNGRTADGAVAPAGVYHVVAFTPGGIESRRVVKW